MNKPACTILYDKKFYFFIFPTALTQKQIDAYTDANVCVRCRNLKPISTKDKNSQIVLEHTIRSTDLANLIISTIDDFLENILQVDKETPMYVSSEGLAYSAKGDATLNLATYKGVLLSKMYEHYFGRMKGLWTYSPITMKSVAGVAKKGELKDKTKMIKAFVREDLNECPFQDALKKGLLISKSNFIPCVDDIVDSYWAVKTMLIKEGFVNSK